MLLTFKQSTGLSNFFTFLQRHLFLHATLCSDKDFPSAGCGKSICCVVNTNPIVFKSDILSRAPLILRLPVTKCVSSEPTVLQEYVRFLLAMSRVRKKESPAMENKVRI